MGFGDDILFSGEAIDAYSRTNRKIIPFDNRTRKIAKSPMWDNLPFIDQNGIELDGVLLPTHPNNGQRWYVKSWSDHIEYSDWKCKRGQLMFDMDEVRNASEKMLDIQEIGKPIIFLNPDVKNTTSADNKDWGIDNWSELAKLLYADDKYSLVQLIPKSNYNDVSGQTKFANVELPYCHHFKTETAREAFSMLVYADYFVSTEGGFHHAAAALRKRGVVIFGGFISPAVTGYDDHINLYVDDEESPCGTLYKSCPHCRKCMDEITPDQVKSNLERLIV